MNSVNLVLQNGETFKRSFLVYGPGKFDLSGSCIFAEVRSATSAKRAIPYPAVITNGSDKVRFVKDIFEAGRDVTYVNPLETGIALGDALSIEGAAVTTVVAVTREHVQVSQNASLSLFGAKASFTAIESARFTPNPDAAGAFKITTTQLATTGQTTISVASLADSIASGKILNFAAPNVSSPGWRFIGSATLSASANSAATSLTVDALVQDIPAGAIALFSPVPFYRFTLDLTPNLVPGSYWWDCLIRKANGETVKIAQGPLTLQPTVSNL